MADKLAVTLKDQVKRLIAPAVATAMTVHSKLGPLGEVVLAISLCCLGGRVEGDTEEGVLDYLKGFAVLGVENEEVLACLCPGVSVVAGQDSNGS